MEKLIDKLQELIEVPNVDQNPKESIRAMKMLNIIVEMRQALSLHSVKASTETLETQLTKVTKSCYTCEYAKTTTIKEVCMYCHNESEWKERN